MSAEMKNFEPAEVQTLAAERRFLLDQSEWRCPACGEVAVRSYLHRADRPNRPTVISYTWCAHCRRATGATSPLPPGLTFDDPWADLSPRQREELEEDSDRMFAELDAMWAKGVLPQRFSGTGGGTRRR
ncbi:hypothetical protein NX794_07200 [Streptomyces sp. LP11]|uniref:Uncharacterized protein n=1 Tax=Streptomyces pyxinicus TaxID=2970331 RepID=A0ABT2AXQ8_9ACTN|nr:hypothetical protein [Streptomyces sp. LP11]MCS0601019.1 hypothetical protein [Streptomyces sp. LP11]